MYLKLKKNVALLFLLVSVNGAEKSRIKFNDNMKSAKIIGGEPAINSEAPYHVAIKVAGRYICSGVLITPQHVLTAGHCLTDVAEYPFLPLTVVAGTDSRSEGGVEKRASEIFIHPLFGGIRPSHDIGVIKLSEPFKESESIKTAKLPEESADVGEQVTVTGFGRFSPFFSIASNNLKKLTSQVTYCGNLLRLLGAVGNGDICVRNPPGEGICNGDSGGPLVNTQGEVVGIASRVFGCAARTPDIYTGVNENLKFINDAISDTTSRSSNDDRMRQFYYDILNSFRNRYYFFYK